MSKSSKMVDKTYTLAGVTYTLCKPPRAPKQITARPVGSRSSSGTYRAGRSGGQS